MTLPTEEPDKVIEPAAGTLTFKVAAVPVTALSFDTLTDAATSLDNGAPLPLPRKLTDPATGTAGGAVGVP